MLAPQASGEESRQTIKMIGYLYLRLSKHNLEKDQFQNLTCNLFDSIRTSNFSAKSFRQFANTVWLSLSGLTASFSSLALVQKIVSDTVFAVKPSPFQILLKKLGFFYSGYFYSVSARFCNSNLMFSIYRCCYRIMRSDSAQILHCRNDSNGEGPINCSSLYYIGALTAEEFSQFEQ